MYKVIERMKSEYSPSEGKPRNFVFGYYKTKKEAQSVAERLTEAFPKYDAVVERSK